MHLLSCYSCIQVVLIIVSTLVCSSHTLPLNPSAQSRSLDVEQLIDPLNPQNHHDDLESKIVLPKSILFTPLRTAAPPINQCPPGHFLSREDGTCIKTITGITLDEATFVAVLDNFYKSKRKPSNRHRHRTTTSRPKVLDFVPTTTEVITESTFESTTAATTTTQPPLLIHQVATSEINPTIFSETNPEAETTTILSTSVNEPGVPGGHEIRNQPTPLHAQQQIYELVPTSTSIPTEMYMTEASIPSELTTFQPSPDQLFNVTFPTDNPLNNITVLSSSDMIINPDGNDDNDEATSTTSKPSSSSPPPPLPLHELQQINDELVPTTTTHPTPQEYITEMNVPSEFETIFPPSSFEPLQILNITFPNPKILPTDNLTNQQLTFTNESRKEETEDPTQQVLFPSTPSFLLLHQGKLERLEKESKQPDEHLIETMLPDQREQINEKEETEGKVMELVILHDDEKDTKEEQRKKLQVQSTLSTSSLHDKDELIIVPVSSTEESTIDSNSSSSSSRSRSSSDTVIKEPL